MKRSSKGKAFRSTGVAGSYYAPADDGGTAGHGQARPTLQGGLAEPERHLHIAFHELIERFSRRSPEAEALADVALAFSKECRGWKDAYCVNDWGYPYISESVPKKLAGTKIPPDERHFHYTHLDKVMAAVRDWLKSEGVIPAHYAGLFVDVIPKVLFDEYLYGTLDETGLCRELMSVCVEANRLRKGPAHA